MKGEREREREREGEREREQVTSPYVQQKQLLRERGGCAPAGRVGSFFTERPNVFDVLQS